MTCPAHFHFVLVTYWTMSVTLVLCLMMVLQSLSFSLTLSIFLSMAHWLVSSFFTNALVASICHFRLMGRCLCRKISLYFLKTLHPTFILIETSCFVLISIAIVCPRYLQLVIFSISVPSICMLSAVLIFVISLVFPLCILRSIFKLSLFSV